ncbi:MFS transporter [Nocardioides mangrovicus]|uniref:MFS transporter n=1 Tax=Nocardioides mangrovicus TaxID=2478913 RepID=A0A3L8NZZ7_9ACTN|nr:MFS transporter [Nocardioides mangrovicus]RLV47879.1 MFS transporter [Nocardioides mangrovicus]
MVPPADRAPVVRSLAGLVGFLVCVELASGVLQGYYTPIFPQIADHLGIHHASVNWFEAAQLVLSALVLPVLSRLGDLIGHRQVLLLSTVITALASWAVALAPDFATFLIAWAVQGCYVVWLPLEISIVHRRTAGAADQDRSTRRAAAYLVAALEVAVIAGALVAGQLGDSVDMRLVLCVPALAVTLCLAAVAYGVPATPPVAAGGRIDKIGLLLLTTSLLLLMGGLVALRLQGVRSPLGYAGIVLALAVLVPFARYEARHPDPLVDVRLLATPGQWPVQLTAFLFGMSVLGAQIPLSTYAQTDRSTGYGLGAGPGFVSVLIGVYVLMLVVGALSLPAASRVLGTRTALAVASLLVAAGYALWIGFHDSTAQALVNMAVAGVGSGALVAALPAAAAAAAPPERTGFATGMTNTTKTVGGAVASSVFAMALSATGTIDTEGAVNAPLSGYLVVWGVCAGSALLAALSLLAATRRTRLSRSSWS